MSLPAYYAAVLSAIAGPLWMPDGDSRGWPVVLFCAWALNCWAIFVYNQPRPKHWPKPPCDCGIA